VPVHRGLVAAFVFASTAAFAAEPPVGDAAIGRALYVGAIGFEKGGAPCIACHGLGGQGRALTASLGPDLSQSSAALDPDILDGVLEDQPYKSMKPIYAGRPITPTERAHIGAFFRESAGEAPAGGGLWFVVQAALLASALGVTLVGPRRRAIPAREEPRRGIRLSQAAGRKVKR